MGNYSRKMLWMVLALLSLVAGGARGQWRIVAPNAVGAADPYTPEEGAMFFKDGILWAGSTKFVFSTDSGSTWNPIHIGLPMDEITAISFLNPDSGIVADREAYATYSTTDGGANWTTSHPFNGSASGSFSEVYYASRSRAYASSPETGLWQSFDGGQTWINLYTTSLQDFGIGDKSVIFALAPDYDFADIHSYLNISKDSGINWNSTPGQAGVDSYSIGLDSCDASMLYVVSENYFTRRPDNISRIYRSSDQGETWQATFAAPDPYLSGSFSSSFHAQYVATISNGILRSTDHGLTWKNIGGPGGVIDSRRICAISDNIIFAFDAAGNIWATYNSGGDSVRESPFATSATSLFDADTVSCNNISRVIFFYRGGCFPPSVSSWSIVGVDSASYEASNLSYDSIFVTLLAIKRGAKHAQLILDLDNGSRDTISLSGYVNHIPISLSTQDAKTDTLGATISVPITINGLERPGDVDLVLHYDGSVDYLGSFSPTGVKLDVPGEQWPGRSALHIAGAIPDSVAGFAKFNVFSDSNEDAHAMFDSLDILTPTLPCEYSAAPSATSTIFPPKGCDIPILSRLVHLGKEPVFNVYPNPATGNVWITSSEDLGMASLTVYDMLGIERRGAPTEVEKGVPLELSLPKASGIYYIAVQTVQGTYRFQILRVR